ncbi:hypothetical protein BVY03_01480 [bacterium K02(2017)]|nr:hypothetical protein BVY03_01480 [bacterium K02(2017)]
MKINRFEYKIYLILAYLLIVIVIPYVTNTGAVIESSSPTVHSIKTNKSSRKYSKNYKKSRRTYQNKR